MGLYTYEGSFKEISISMYDCFGTNIMSIINHTATMMYEKLPSNLYTCESSYYSLYLQIIHVIGLYANDLSVTSVKHPSLLVFQVGHLHPWSWSKDSEFSSMTIWLSFLLQTVTQQLHTETHQWFGESEYCIHWFWLLLLWNLGCCWGQLF